MSTVYIVGAGASYGDAIKIKDEKHLAITTPTAPPMIRGFFRKELLASIRYSPEQVVLDFPDAFRWIRTEIPKTKDTPVGESPWDQINIEEIFTAVELRHEFESPESDEGANLRLIRNQLIRYITRIIGLCTQNCYGEYSRILVGLLRDEDSLFTFNWDLLLDDHFPSGGTTDGHLYHFLRTRDGYARSVWNSRRHGLFLKLHGSLNWFTCTNPKCKFASELQINNNIQGCLSRAAGLATDSSDICCYCGSQTAPLIIPPLVRKPITDPMIRSIWGLARNILREAERMVLVGFSAAPTDFFVGWLLHSTALENPELDVVVVNPLNDPEAEGHAGFVERMKQLFPYELNTEFREFSGFCDWLIRASTKG